MSYVHLGPHVHLQLHKVSNEGQEVAQEHNGCCPLSKRTDEMFSVTLGRGNKYVSVYRCISLI